MEKRPTRSVSHKGEKVCSYTVDFKLEVVNYAEQSSIHAAGRKYNVSRSSVRDWKKKKVQLEELRKSSGSGAHRRRLSGGGRKVFDSSTEKSLIEWITERKQQGLTISGALIIKKAKSLQQEKLQKQQLMMMEVKQEGDEDQDVQHTPESSSAQKKLASNRLTYSRGWLEKFMNRNGLALKNFPTYKSPLTSAEETKIEMNEPLPTVIPLDDLLPGELQDDGSFMSREMSDDGSFTSSEIRDEKSFIAREIRDDEYVNRELQDDGSFMTRDVRDDGSYPNREIRDDGTYKTRERRDNRSFTTREYRDDGPFKSREMREEASYTTREMHDDGPFTKREILDEESFATREMRDERSYTTREISDDRLRRNTPSTHRESELDKNIDEMHDFRSLKSKSCEIRKYSDIRKPRSLDTKHLIDTPIRKTFEKVRHIHPPSVISIDEAYKRSKAPHIIPKVEPDDTYGHASSSTIFSKGRLDRYPHATPITTYQLTRMGDTYLRHSIPCNTFYKSRPDATYAGIPSTANYYKSRGGHTYSYSSPNTTLHKSRFHDSFTTTNKTYHNAPSDDSFTYTSPNTTYIKTRIDSSSFTHTSSSAFHKSRDMQNPIVIPLDDILPE